MSRVFVGGLGVLMFMMALSAYSLAQTPLSTAFTYQGQLNKSGSAVNSTADFQFTLFDDPIAGNQVGAIVSLNALSVSDGLFTVPLDFGTAAFDGNARWLQIALRSPAGSGVFTTLNPRQPLTAAPYALFARNNWSLGGNAGTNPTTSFLGTPDNQPLVLKTNNRRAMQYQYAENIPSGFRSNNALGGADVNSIVAGVVGATIAGGGKDVFSGTDSPNQVIANFGAIGGGIGNTAGDSATVGGGEANTASGRDSTIAGGTANLADSTDATVAGGELNTANNDEATVGGGYNNLASGTDSTVAGGVGNSATSYDTTVGGGNGNTASGDESTVAGGVSNIASGYGAAVPGGRFNTAAGDYAFSAGRNAQASHDGAFVWGDDTNTTFASTAINQFNVRASGGARIFSNSTATTGVLLAAGGGSWSSASDRNLKTNFQTVNSTEVLESLCAIPITTWNYKASADIRHMGVMSQDFHAAFGGLGLDDRHIDTLDADGVAFAAIQGLNRKVTVQSAELQDLKEKLAVIGAQFNAARSSNEELAERIARLESAVAKLSHQQLEPFNN